MSLGDEDVRRIATLARLDLAEDEVAQMTPQLESILGFVEQLSELSTDDVEPMTSALDVQNRWRDDRVVEGLSCDQAMSMAPSTDGEYFLVPSVLGSKGE